MAVLRSFRRGDVPADPTRVPPGQYVTTGFPVLSAGPTPSTATADWSFRVHGAVRHERSWSWTEFRALPRVHVTVDLHCVTGWSKLDTTWAGVSVDTLLDAAEPTGRFVLATGDGGYTTSVPIEDLRGGRAWVVDTFEQQPLEPEHGGPARLLIPHLYLWKSAKWVRGLEVLDHERHGFWERHGYHAYGDPWREQRYAGD